MNKKIIWGIIGIVVLVLIGATVYYSETNQPVRLSSTDWKVYENTKLGISLEYPQTWKSEEYEDEFSWHVKFSEINDLVSPTPYQGKDSLEIKSGCNTVTYGESWKINNEGLGDSVWKKEICLGINYSIIALATNGSAKIIDDKIISTLSFTSSAYKHNKANSIPYGARVRVISPNQDNGNGVTEIHKVGEKMAIEWYIDRSAAKFNVDLIDANTREVVRTITSNEFIKSSVVDNKFAYEWIVRSSGKGDRYMLSIYPSENKDLVGRSGEFIIEIPRPNSNYPSGVQGKCGITVDQPLAHTNVKFPLNINGIIDNTNYKALGCSWGMFEGTAGVVQLFYNYNNQGWKSIGRSEPIYVDDWTTNYTFFKAVIADSDNSLMEIPDNTPMKIVFTEENAAGFDSYDTFELPINFIK